MFIVDYEDLMHAIENKWKYFFCDFSSVSISNHEYDSYPRNNFEFWRCTCSWNCKFSNYIIKDFKIEKFLMKIRWVIYNQFKVLLLFDGFVASNIKLEYDVFTIIQGFRNFDMISYISFSRCIFNCSYSLFWTRVFPDRLISDNIFYLHSNMLKIGFNSDKEAAVRVVHCRNRDSKHQILFKQFFFIWIKSYF